jgi:ElaB/YqjD/DUF883 family membrane-anchored ribosome-binding protein
MALIVLAASPPVFDDRREDPAPEEKIMRHRVTTEKLRADLQTVVEDAEELLKATSAQTGERIQGVRAKAEQSLHKARARLAEAEADAVERVRRAATTTEAYVQERPWESVGVAAGIGFLLGLLISRR